MQAIAKDGWILVHRASGWPVVMHEICADFRGNAHLITGGEPPHKPSSTGRVYVTGGSEFYPSVYDMKWIRSSELG